MQYALLHVYALINIFCPMHSLKCLDKHKIAKLYQPYCGVNAKWFYLLFYSIALGSFMRFFLYMAYKYEKSRITSCALHVSFIYNNSIPIIKNISVSDCPNCILISYIVVLTLQHPCHMLLSYNIYTISLQQAAL